MDASRTGRGGLRALAAPFLATVVGLAILVSLGVWQLERKAWKEGLIAQIAARSYGEPGPIVPEARWPDWTAGTDEFRRVTVSGTFLPDATVALHGLAELKARQASQGFYLFVPLRLDEGSTVLINRGFVPTEDAAATVAALRAEQTRATVTGLVRAPETRTLFVPENDPRTERWFVRTVAEMAAARRLERVAPFYVDEDGSAHPGSWPRGGQTQLTLRNEHLHYAFTWFGLAATLIGVFGVFAHGRLKGPDSDPARDADRGRTVTPGP